MTIPLPPPPSLASPLPSPAPRKTIPAAAARTIAGALVLPACAWLAPPADAACLAVADDANAGFLLLTRDGQMRAIRLASISDQSLVHMDQARGWVTLDLAQCVALLSQEAEAAGTSWDRADGVVVLADGQRLPGEAVTDSPPQPDVLAWNHPWLGRVDVPLKLIESVLFDADTAAPLLTSAGADAVLLGNGDVQEGLVIAIGDPVSIETGEGASKQTMEIPLSRVMAIRMIAPRPSGSGRRVWFNEGTVLDVQSLGVGDDGLVRMTGAALALANAAQPPAVGVDEIAAVLFDRQRLLPLALQAPSRIEGPATRYTLPRPARLDPEAPLGLSTLEFSGPITVRYALPAGCERFLADAELPREARAWGDCELIVRSDDEQVFRATLNGAAPHASISVPLKGRELTIEITAGEHGPIQDLVRLHRPMLLKSR